MFSGLEANNVEVESIPMRELERDRVSLPRARCLPIARLLELRRREFCVKFYKPDAPASACIGRITKGTHSLARRACIAEV